jgi:AraC family transcriptional regulator, transcriptional activator FtrA
MMPIVNPRLKPFNPLVVAVAYPGLCSFEFACTTEVFGLPRPEFGERWYRFETCSMGGRPVKGQYGARYAVDGGLEGLARAGTIIIPGWAGPDIAVPESLLQALRDAYARGARLLSICSGSFVLAATGLLDGRRATTHWRYAEELIRRHPQISVDPNVLYVDEGQILTSAGSAAGLDLCLHLARRDFGAEVANQVARRLVIPPHRDGGQAQFVERPVDRRERGPLSAVLERVRRQLHRPVSVGQMARWAAMSERTFIRRFRAMTGMTPGDWVIHERVALAQELLESSQFGIEQIAGRCGLGTGTTMRHHFRKRIGVSPVAYRKRFSQLSGEGP